MTAAARVPAARLRWRRWRPLSDVGSAAASFVNFDAVSPAKEEGREQRAPRDGGGHGGGDSGNRTLFLPL